jgi:hypothetical protein
MIGSTFAAKLAASSTCTLRPSAAASAGAATVRPRGAAPRLLER